MTNTVRNNHIIPTKEKGTLIFHTEAKTQTTPGSKMKRKKPVTRRLFTTTKVVLNLHAAARAILLEDG